MSDENWALVQRAWGVPKKEWGPLYRRNARVLGWPSDAFLRKQAFLRWREKPTPRTIARAASEVVKVISPAEVLERRLAEQDSYVMEALADPDRPEEKKTELKKWWESNPENAERSPPWKKNERPAPEGSDMKGGGKWGCGVDTPTNYWTCCACQNWNWHTRDRCYLCGHRKGERREEKKSKAAVYLRVSSRGRVGQTRNPTASGCVRRAGRHPSSIASAKAG